MSHPHENTANPIEHRDWLKYFEQAQPRILALLEHMVCHESPSDDAERCSALARWIRDELRRSGVHAETVPCPPRGDAVLAHIGPQNGRGALLLGHHDTVWPVGSLAELPYTSKNDRGTGPGIFDMKSGIALAMTVLETLAREPAPPPVTLLLVSDEEVRSLASRALTVATAERHRCVLVLEPSLDGAAKVARKGTGFFTIRFRGKPAHAGLEPEKGISALSEMARYVLFLETLNNAEHGTSVVPTVATAGSVLNVVPELAEVSVDTRIWLQSEAERVENAIRGYRPTDARVTFKVDGKYNRPPMEETVESKRLYQRAREIASSLGFELAAARVGGASDGNLTAAAGVPTLDGLGPRGAGAHARHEHIVLSDLARRAALLTKLVLE